MPSDQLADALASVVARLAAIRSAPGASDLRPDDLIDQIQGAIKDAALPTLVANDQGRYVAASESACLLTGYMCEELRRRFIWDLTALATRAEYEPLWRAFITQGRQRGSYALEHSDGRPIDVEYIAQAHALKGFHVSVLAPVTGS